MMHDVEVLDFGAATQLNNSKFTIERAWQREREELEVLKSSLTLILIKGRTRGLTSFSSELQSQQKDLEDICDMGRDAGGRKEILNQVRDAVETWDFF
ncbi:hypothetical protein Sjap_004834 [Stephania japonica]|uniref:Uncharacterized protein n=1 Tax=Stephania japonica TaxID=461633 RepID=A0AAP0K2W9_9MAGN